MKSKTLHVSLHEFYSALENCVGIFWEDDDDADISFPNFIQLTGEYKNIFLHIVPNNQHPLRNPNKTKNFLEGHNQTIPIQKTPNQGTKYFLRDSNANEVEIFLLGAL